MFWGLLVCPGRRGPIFHAVPGRTLASDCRAFDVQTVRPGVQVEFQIDIGLTSQRQRFSADACVAVAYPPLKRPERLPFEAIGGKPVSVPLADRVAAQAHSGILIVALMAGQVELSVGVVRCSGASGIDRQRDAARLVGDIDGEGEQVIAFMV